LKNKGFLRFYNEKALRPGPAGTKRESFEKRQFGRIAIYLEQR